MYLKQLRLKGFKSFANKTVLDFTPGISVVVGPNGSGKSNVADAVRWVLGEQSAKTLRGSKMEDIIFSGSKEKKPVGMAQVTLVLDNENGRLPLDFNEVAVSRRVFRSGESEFLINKTQCRLKDIHELFMDTGVGKESFSLIGQGKVEEILNSKPEDRRYLVEEAAGISKYRYRKQQAVRKLEDTQKNINRLQDLIQEISTQLPPLAEQAETARQYRELKSELDSLEIKAYVWEITKLLDRLEEQGREREQMAADLEERETETRVLEAKLEEERLLLSRLEEEIASFQQALFDKENRLQRLEGDIALEREKRDNASNRMQELQLEQARLDAKQDQYQRSIAEFTVKLEAVQAELAAMKQRVAEMEQAYREAADSYAQFTEAAEGIKNEIFDLLHQESSLNNDLTRIDQNRQNSRKQLERIEQQLDEYNDKIKKNETDAKSVADAAESLKQAADDVETRAALKAVAREKVEERLKQAARQQAALHDKLGRTAARLETLQDLSKSYEGYFAGVRSILAASEKGLLNGGGICGAVAQMLTVPEKYEVAIETALGSAAQNIIVDSSKDAQKAIAFLKRRQGGRATFLPLDTVQPRLVPQRLKKLFDAEGIVGEAKSLIGIRSKYRPVLEHLLGNVFVATDIKAAVAAAKAVGFGAKIVTLDGEVVSPGGALTGGSRGIKETGLIRREGEIKRLTEQRQALEQELKSSAQAVTAAENELSDCRQQQERFTETLRQQRGQLETLDNNHRALMRELDGLKDNAEHLLWQKDQLTEEMSSLSVHAEEINSKLLSVRSQKQLLEQGLQDQAVRSQSVDAEKNNLAEELTGLKVALAAMEQERSGVADKLSAQQQLLAENSEEIKSKAAETARLKDIAAQAAAVLEDKGKESREIIAAQEQLQNQVDNLREQRQERRRQLGDWEQNLKANAKVLQALQQNLSQMDVKITRWETEKENQLNRLWDGHGLSYEQALLQHQEVEEVKGLTSRVRQLRRQIEALGTVNLGAVEEYERINERYQFLTKQLTDLQEARLSLNQVIAEMQAIMKGKFIETFNEVDRHFRDMFEQMFGGGTANLALTETEDVLEAGIDIIAQPPGKKLSNLTLLSGGEKALTAIALLFGILRYKPSPFCLLDEIDASLDETNVDRFAHVLKEFAKTTQFIIISHRQGTMEIAEDLYGVTMDKSGISKLVSVKLEGSQVS